MSETKRRDASKVKRRKYTVGFFLTMPNRASWNGHWSGENSVHVIMKTVPAKYFEEHKSQLIGTWSYSWDDGWRAEINSRIIEPGERASLLRRNTGFSGYGWMVDSIMLTGEIVYPQKDA